MLRGAMAILLVAATSSSVARAQALLDAVVKPELRADAITSRSQTVVQAGGGVEIPAGYYARVGVIGAVGAPLASVGRNLSGRLDVIARFLFDPFREHAWGLSAGAGVSMRVAEHDKVRPYLASVIDLEGPRGASGIAPAFQVGLGGGIRVGAALRWGGRVSR
ncbi:hypothetical protein BH09GEM1_BH09GEM1_13540 [soil metagenome]